MGRDCQPRIVDYENCWTPIECRMTNFGAVGLVQKVVNSQ